MARKSKAPRRRKREDRFAGRRRKKECVVCKNGGTIDYKDTALLRKMMSDRGKIRPSRVTGCHPKCQRKVARAIKNAREMALLPYVGTRS